MPERLLVAAVVVAALDAALRDWRGGRRFPEAMATNALFLAIAWVPFFVLPHVSLPVVALWCLSVSTVAFIDFARMVGLSVHGRYVLPALALIAGCFPLAAVRDGALLPSVPVGALLVFAAAGAAARAEEGFLQKLCLAWLGVLVYGYLYAHAVVIGHAQWQSLSGPVSGTTVLALVILLAKFANVAWLAARRASGRTRIMLFAAPLGGALGGAVVQWLWPAVPAASLPLVGLAIGLGLGTGCRAHTLIVADVTGEPEAQRKGTMLFGFGVALAVGYWAIVLLR